MTPMRNTRVRWGGIPLHDDGTEMMGTHGSVRKGEDRILAHVVSGEYVSERNFIRFTVSKYGTPGVTYAIFRGGFSASARRVGTYTVPAKEGK